MDRHAERQNTRFSSQNQNKGYYWAINGQKILSLRWQCSRRTCLQTSSPGGSRSRSHRQSHCHSHCRQCVASTPTIAAKTTRTISLVHSSPCPQTTFFQIHRQSCQFCDSLVSELLMCYIYEQIIVQSIRTLLPQILRPSLRPSQSSPHLKQIPEPSNSMDIIVECAIERAKR
jgi:hypothetical protein